MALLLEQAFNGAALGALYALSGLALWLMLRATGEVNIAQAGAISLAALAGRYGSASLSLHFLLAVVPAMLAGAAVVVLVDLLAWQAPAFRLRRFRMAGVPAASGGGVPSPEGLVLAVALWLALDALADMAAGHAALPLPPGSARFGLLALGELHVPGLQLFALLLVAGAAAWLNWLLHRTRFGAAQRALAADPTSAALSGVDVRPTRLAAAGLAGALAGLAGLFGAAVLAGTAPALGGGLMLKGLVVAIAGGRAGPWGVVAAALALGVAEVACAAWFAFTLRDALGYAVLLGLLLWPGLRLPAGRG